MDNPEWLRCRVPEDLAYKIIGECLYAFKNGKRYSIGLGEALNQGG
jgi:hypothetical protein